MEIENKKKALKKQIEYYMSDQNLKNDKFFHNLIRDAPERQIPIDVLFNCKRIKLLAPTTEEVIEAIEDSHYLSMGADKKSFGRINYHLPILRSKRIYVTFEKDYQREPKEKEMQDSFIIFYPLVIQIFCDKKINVKPREMQKKLQKQFIIDFPFIKLSRKKGWIVLNKNSLTQKEIDDFLANETIEVGTCNFTMKLYDEKQAQDWMDQYRQDLELSLKKRYHASIKKGKEQNNEDQKKINLDENWGPFEIQERKFRDIRALKNQIKLIVNKTRNGDEIKDKDFELMKEILSHHPDKEKVKNINSIVVDKHPEFKITRCFFIKNDKNELEDISFHKCLGFLWLHLKNKQKKDQQ